jgi:hypothetical protein
MGCTGGGDRVGPLVGMGDQVQGEQQGEQRNLEDTVRRAREEMHSVTESLRALLPLLQDLRGGDEPPPTGARSPESAPNP